ncbi:PREDICTED: exosome component 10 [Dinoponera quadriceps]|uniref:Exosome complex component 10 homolog n=1 Tax=Dinoponera quadriceps TaxID=609295 RepID=A0A6P3X851_DINQU|nr:PREDICTED: exosome component 10 [Dinoponera quadriceps]
MESSEDCDNEANTLQEDNIQQTENNAPPPSRLIPGFDTFVEYLEEAHDALKAGIKTANNLPTGEHYDYYAFFQSFQDAKNRDVKRILATIQAIMKLAGSSGNIKHRDDDEKFDLLLETNDLLLDQANVWMDEESGILQNPEVQLVVSQIKRPTVNGSWNTKKATAVSDDSQNIRLLGGKNVQKPQFMFKDKIDNSLKPWQPRIKEKPNNLKPLALYVEEGENGEVFNHPYAFELNKFETPECQLKKSVPVRYKSLDNTQLIFITAPSDIGIILEDLKNYKEIAVDLEHHSYRSFQGITCLMQISTVDTDYLIDTLSLRSELHQLNEIFTKPTILKVFHGADLDIQWLQRDLSLYVVNMFDTHQAAKQLQFPYLSLAYLLKKYCNIDPNKHFQLADWRIRPLPEELMKYAREDTHYLLYIKDLLKNELIESANGQNNILKAVYDMSTDICKRTYVKPIWTMESCKNMYRRSQKMFNNRQLYAFKELHKWRDVTAREEDDSIGYVLPNHMLLNIAETLPREMQGILACCNPIPPFVRKNLLMLHKIVLKAREQPLVKTIPEDDFRQRLAQRTHVANADVWIHSSHDIPKGTEARADLPCLLDKVDTAWPVSSESVVMKHTVTLFDTSEDETENIKKPIFVSPFQRYKCVIPMIVELEAKELERQRKEEEEKRRGGDAAAEETNVESLDQAEISESKGRVYEHFKQVSQSSNEEVQGVFQKKKKKKKKKKKNGNTEILLGQMHGRKRKRESGIARESVSQDRSDHHDFCTPAPSLDAKIRHMPKKMRQEMRNAAEEQRVRENLAQVQGDRNTQAIQPIRSKKKGEKKATAKLLKQQGMLPSGKFNYKEVDFNSFQGGSMQNNAVTQITQFQQPKQKKPRHRDWKKQFKVNI